jgi:hypothetical protein
MPDWQAGKVQRQSTNGGLTSHNFTPFRDANPKCPAEARYKALAGGRGGLTAFQSADGIHWQPMADKPVITQGASIRRTWPSGTHTPGSIGSTTVSSAGSATS